MNIKIRPANLKDIKSLNFLQHQLVIYERPLTSTIKGSGKIRYYDIKKLIASTRVLLLVAEDRCKIVGCCFGEIRKNETWSTFKHSGYIGMMFVDEKYRGKGLGKLLMNGVIKWLAKNKIKDIRLKVYNKNVEAIKCYQNCGFKDHILEMIYSKRFKPLRN